MTEQEIEDFQWSCIEQAKNYKTPQNSDGYNEHEVLQAVKRMYEKCKEVWESDAEKWKQLVDYCTEISCSYTDSEIDSMNNEDEVAQQVALKVCNKIAEINSKK